MMAWKDVDGTGEQSTHEDTVALIVQAAEDKGFDPSKVTQLLGIEPTGVVRAGDVLRSGGRSRFDSWTYEEPVGDSCGEALGTLMDRISPHVESLRSFSERAGATVLALCLVDVNNWWGEEFGPDLLRQLAAAGAALEVHRLR
jgi:hypothetical protein